MKFLIHNPKRDTNPEKDKIFKDLSQVLIITLEDVEDWEIHYWKHFNSATIKVVLLPKIYKDKTIFDEQFKKSECWKVIRDYCLKAEFIYY